MSKIRVEELSIGDWVQDKNGKYAQILGIENWSDGYVLNVRINGVDVGCVPASSAHPIPITPEMLEKNGWRNDGMYAILRIDEHLHLEYYYHEHRLRKWYCGIDEWTNHAKVNDITFQAHCYSVHHLQHALRLAGVDKEITL